MKRLSLLLLFALGMIRAEATVTWNIVTPVCSNNGVLQATSNLPGTLTYVFKDFYTYATLTSNTTGLLSGYNGGFVSVWVYNGGTQPIEYANYYGAPPFNYSVTTTPAVCPALGTATANITGGTAPYTVQWYNQSNVLVATGNPASLPGGVYPAGRYNVLITDAAGCTFGTYAQHDSIHVPYNTNINFSLSATAANCTNGSVTSSAPTGGTAPYSYAWSNAASTPAIFGLSTGNYQLTVTDAIGCYKTNSAFVQQSVNIPVNVTPTPATCLQNNGSAIAFGSGGMPPYTYAWSNTQTTQTATGLLGYTTYSVVATDANGCKGTGYTYISASTPITATSSSTPSQCTTANGTASVVASGGTPPYTYQWSSYPVQTTATANGLAPGSYNFTITDAVGCVRTGTVNVPPVSIITASINSTSPVCTASNGAASVTVTSGTPPYTYAWNNSQTTAAISGIPAGTYSVTITDAMSCSITKSKTITPYSPVNVGFNTVPASCIYNTDGSITAIPTGGTAPYSYVWYGISQTTPTATNLGQGLYNVKVTDAAGCTKTSSAAVSYNPSNNSCYCTVTGKAYVDANANCTLDAGEAGIPNIMIHAAGFGYAYTNLSGIYSFKVPTGSYTLSESIQATYPLASCQNNAVPVTVTASPSCSTTVNFANTLATIHDVAIQTTNFTCPPVPGTTYKQLVVIQNAGTVTESGIKAGYKTDGQLGSVVFNAPAFTAAGGNQYNSTASFPTLAPSGSVAYLAQYAVPTNIPLNTAVTVRDTVSYTAPMSNWLNDYTPWNNVGYHTAYVVSSFDPNYKEVSPRGTGANGLIQTSDSTLTYTLHFQNTGTWPAQKVVLIDTLDTDLNISTIKPGYSTHNYVATVNENGVLQFTFDNINLPDSTSNPAGSQGLVIYTVRLKPNLALGTQIHNNADIYFDYNSPVRTNTTLNTLANPSGITPASTSANNVLRVYPNPASNRVSIAVNAATGFGAVLSIRNILGQEMAQQPVTLKAGENLFSADLSNMAPGLYFVELNDGRSRSVTKLNVVR